MKMVEHEEVVATKAGKNPRPWEIFDAQSVDTVDHVAFVNNNHINTNNNIVKTTKKDVIDRSSASNTLKKSKTAFKHMTVAKLFGKNYDIKKSLVYKNKKPLESPKPQRKVNHEKFYGRSYEDPIVRHREEHHDSRHEPKPFWTLSRSVGKLLRRNYSSVDISIPDPEYKVAYLGNVLTGWAKGKLMFLFC